MPSLRDFLPPPPWEGPPIPKILTGKGGNDPTDPHQLEVDTGRGVLYVHSLLRGVTALRVCRIPDESVRLFASEDGIVVIDLRGYSHRLEPHLKGRTIKKEPVFFDIREDSFTVRSQAGVTLFEFKNVPLRLINDLRLGDFVDITLGYTGKE